MHFPRSFQVSWQQCASSEASFRTFHSINPANPQRPNNVVTTSLQRSCSDVVTTLLRRCVFFGKISLQAINECYTVWYDSTFSEFGIMVKYQLKIRGSQQINSVVTMSSGRHHDVQTTLLRRSVFTWASKPSRNNVVLTSQWCPNDVVTTFYVYW